MQVLSFHLTRKKSEKKNERETILTNLVMTDTFKTQD